MKFKCLCCNIEMKFFKKQSIEEKDLLSGISTIGEFFAESVDCKWYLCPKCKVIELHLIKDDKGWLE